MDHTFRKRIGELRDAYDYYDYWDYSDGNSEDNFEEERAKYEHEQEKLDDLVTQFEQRKQDIEASLRLLETKIRNDMRLAADRVKEERAKLSSLRRQVNSNHRNNMQFRQQKRRKETEIIETRKRVKFEEEILAGKRKQFEANQKVIKERLSKLDGNIGREQVEIHRLNDRENFLCRGFFIVGCLKWEKDYAAENRAMARKTSLELDRKSEQEKLDRSIQSMNTEIAVGKEAVKQRRDSYLAAQNKESEIQQAMKDLTAEMEHLESRIGGTEREVDIRRQDIAAKMEQLELEQKNAREKLKLELQSFQLKMESAREAIAARQANYNTARETMAAERKRNLEIKKDVASIQRDISDKVGSSLTLYEVRKLLQVVRSTVAALKKSWVHLTQYFDRMNVNINTALGNELEGFVAQARDAAAGTSLGLAKYV